MVTGVVTHGDTAFVEHTMHSMEKFSKTDGNACGNACGNAVTRGNT